MTASFSHVDLLHLAMNMASLYQVGWLEEMYGSVLYLHFSLCLVVTTMIVSLVIYHVMIKRFGKVRCPALALPPCCVSVPVRLGSIEVSFSGCDGDVAVRCGRCCRDLVCSLVY